ncbi:MAG: hypothetical protein JSW14_05455 [Candidatus Bathyarchaeum sp.]|nr:MAG: hypothetical protein JSW14_05455 [Candidatus Bathyarchaeum sp.]
MLEMLTQFLDTLLNSGVLVPAIWLSLGFCIAWFLLSAKRSIALSSKEAEMLWKVHKQKTRCNAKKCKKITRRGKIIGFKCECGYKHIQKKPIVSVSI